MPNDPSPYHASAPHTLRDRLVRFKLGLAYRHYRRFIRRYLPSDNGQMALLDVGCGPGYFLSFARSWFPQAALVGLDYDASLCREARQRLGGGASLVQGDAHHLALVGEQFDVVVALHVLEHLAAPASFICEARRALKPGGILLLATPNPDGIGARMMRERWSGYRDDHISLKAPRQWRDLLLAAGFTPLREGTTGLTGIPAFRQLPLAIINWGALAMFGFFPWRHGEAYVAAWRRSDEVIG